MPKNREKREKREATASAVSAASAASISQKKGKRIENLARQRARQLIREQCYTFIAEKKWAEVKRHPHLDLEDYRRLAASILRLKFFTAEAATVVDRLWPMPSLAERMYQLMAENASWEAIQWYLEQGAPMEVSKEVVYPWQAGNEIVLFHIMVHYPSRLLEILPVLLRMGMDPNVQRPCGKREERAGGETALMWYVLFVIRNVWTLEMGVIELLLEAGCDPLLEDKQGRTVFDYVEYLYCENAIQWKEDERGLRSKEEKATLLRALRAWA